MISAEDLKETLSKQKVKPAAVYITSPDYLGNTADIAALAQIAHSYGVPLLCDNAHGRTETERSVGRLFIQESC